MRERSLSCVPKSALLLLAAGLALQVAYHCSLPPRPAKAVDLPPPPSAILLRLASFGEPVALARALTLHLQSFDNQAGISLPFRALDYDQVQAWLERALELDPHGQYPLMMASRLYGAFGKPAQQRQMLEFVHQRFLEDPNRRWPWLANAVVSAKHNLKDLPLATKYAHAIRIHATGKEVPDWTRQMEIFLLEDMDELESAKVLLGGLLSSGQITDPHELAFLLQRLQELELKTRAGK